MENPFKPAEHYSPKLVLITALFSFVGIAVLAAIDANVHNQWIVASFGSTAVLIYAAPKAAFSKPKNVYFSHIFAAIFSIAVTCVFDAADCYESLLWVCCGLCVTGSIVIMMYTGTIHPPAGATALTVALSGITDFEFVIFPLAVGLLVMMAIAYGANRLKEKYAEKE